MKQKFLAKISLGLLCLFSLMACRIEEPIRQNEDYKKFATFTSKNGEVVNYAKGFKKLFERYDLLYEAQNTKRAVTKNTLNKSIATDVEYVEFNIHSEEITNDSLTVMVFPIIKNDLVTGLSMAKLEKQNTQLILERVSDTSPNYSLVLNLFINAYSEALNKSNGNKMKTGDIEEVIITIVKPVILHLAPAYVNVKSEDCKELHDCPENSDDGNGGGGDSGASNQNNEDLCDSGTKNSLNQSAVKDKLDSLKEKSKSEGEKGFSVRKDGSSSPMITGDKHHVNITVNNTDLGGFHNHTPEGIKMLTPPNDIIKLFEYAMQQPQDNLSAAFFGMVATNVCSACPGGYKTYKYIIRFTGNYQELINYTYNTTYNKDLLIKDFTKNSQNYQDKPEYMDYNLGELNNKGLEKLFFESIKLMGLEGKIALQKIEDNGNISNIALGENGQPITFPCT